MQNTPNHPLTLSLTLATIAFADPGVDGPDPAARNDAARNAPETHATPTSDESPPDVSGDADVKRNDPKIVEALRSTPWAAGPPGRPPMLSRRPCVRACDLQGGTG